MKNMILIMIASSLVCLSLNCYADDYTVNSIGNFDYVNGPDGYSGTGQQIGNFYYYNDNRADSYNEQSIGNFDYVTGSNGYSGTGQRIGNFYYYDDNE